MKKKSLLTQIKLMIFSIKDFQDKSYSLLTLDDGFENNYEFAREILNELNIKAIFFVIPSFINSDKKDISIRYFESLYPTENKIQY